MSSSRWLIRLVVVLAAVCAVVDCSRFLQTGDRTVTATSNALKVCVCFLATLVAYRAGSMAADARLYRLVFALIFAADVCFVTGLEPLGIVLFAVVQGLLTRRNMMGWRAAHLGQHSADIFGVAATAAGLLALTVAGIYWARRCSLSSASTSACWPPL
jgi:chromate transport protein ChrA